MTGERSRLVADAFHEAAIAGDGVGPVVDGPVAEARIQQALGQRHADGVAEPLAERSRRRLDPGGVAEFRMAGRAAAELAEVLQLLHRHVLIAGEIQQGVEQHGAVPGGEHETVAVRPVGTQRIEREEAREQHRGNVGHAHGHAGVPRIGPLHRVHGERADRVGHVTWIGARRASGSQITRLRNR